MHTIKILILSYFQKVIPKFIKQLKNNEKVTIQGDGSCLRSFLHSYDVSQAFKFILETSTSKGFSLSAEQEKPAIKRNTR